MIRPDFYAVLGITPTASADDIRQAFRDLARQYHPDANPHDPNAAEHFKVINEAYRVLGTPQLRTAYDQALRMVSPGSPGALGHDTGHSQQPPNASAHMARVTQTTRGNMPTPSVPNPNAARGTAPVAPMPVTPAKPTLALRATPAQAAIMPPSEPTRFYMLTELGSTQDAAVLDPLPLDLALLIDRSNSMKGDKIFEAKRGVLNMLNQLRADDLLTLVFFDDRAEVLADGETVQGRAGIENALDRLSVRGSTEIANGLQTTLERLAARQTRTRVATLVLLTDGRTYGDERRCLELAAYARDLGVSITALGIGTDWNRDLLDRLAAISGGSSNYVERPKDLQPIFEEVVLRLRATLAASMRLTFEPAPGVHIARATRIAPDIAEVFGGSGGGPVAAAAEPGPVTVHLGALVGRPEVESAVILWELLFDPSTFTPKDGQFDIGHLSASYWAPRLSGGQTERLESTLRLPVNLSGQHAPISSDARLALELVTAYRLQEQADLLKASGKGSEAATRMTTSALRLQTAGYTELAERARHAAKALGGAGSDGVAETLQVKYGTKNLGIFHRLRKQLTGHGS